MQAFLFKEETCFVMKVVPMHLCKRGNEKHIPLYEFWIVVTRNFSTHKKGAVISKMGLKTR